MLWIDGIASEPAAPLDRGLEFGDGLFETMAVLNGRVRLLDRHLDRLAAGCARLGIKPPSRDLLRAEIIAAARAPGTAVLKLVLTRGDGGLGYAVDESRLSRRYLVAAPLRRRAPSALERGVRVATLPTPMAIQPRLAGIKHLNRLEQVLFRQDVAALGVDEGLVADPEGRLVCGSMSNVFLLLNGTLTTPALHRCGIDGVMRGALLAVCARLGIAVAVRDVMLSECVGASEGFLTNALIGLWPIGEFDGRALSVGPVTRRLMDEVATWQD